jgi:predicted secreted protein
MKVLVSVLLITAAVPWLMAGRLDAQDTGDVALSVAGDRCSGMIVAQRGKEFTVALDSNATTGYCWELSAPLDGAIVRLVKTKYRPGA